MSLDEFNRLSRIKINLERRALIIKGVRDFFFREAFTEIETPLRIPAIAPEQFITPYTSEDWFLSTSPELQMKRLLSAGYENIFQICHCFRKDECGRHHNPEFTMLEWYRAGADYRNIIGDTGQLVNYLANLLGQGANLEYQGKTIDLTLPWPEIKVREAYQLWAGWDPAVNFDGQRFDDDMVDKIIPNFSSGKPTVILDYPIECASLARLKPGDPPLAERAEIFIGGLEIGNAYSELNNADEQKKRFKQEVAKMQLVGKPAVLPYNFLEAVKNLPECGGIAVGLDRLVMLFSNACSIDNVIAFPADKL